MLNTNDGWLYGAGEEKIGKIVNGGVKEGKRLKAKFFKAYPQIKSLMDAVQLAVEKRGYLIGLDGRKMKTRSPHSALNLLLQGAGALVMKQALIECKRMCDEEGWKLIEDYSFVINCHDEWQAEVRPEYAERFAEISVQAIQAAGKYFNFRCPLDGEAKKGETWADTH